VIRAKRRLCEIASGLQLGCSAIRVQTQESKRDSEHLAHAREPIDPVAWL